MGRVWKFACERRVLVDAEPVACLRLKRVEELQPAEEPLGSWRGPGDGAGCRVVGGRLLTLGCLQFAQPLLLSGERASPLLGSWFSRPDGQSHGSPSPSRAAASGCSPRLAWPMRCAISSFSSLRRAGVFANVTWLNRK